MSKKKRQSKAKLRQANASKPKVVATKKERLVPTKSRTKSSSRAASAEVSLVYGKKSFMLILVGIAFITLGMLLMSGGSMPSPDVWDESIIYGFRRITLAPMSILLGLGVVLYAIFAPAHSNGRDH